MRLLLLVLPLLLPPAGAGSGGPDAGDIVWTDSLEAGGPPYAWIDATDGQAWPLDDDGTVTVELPFGFDLYGVSYESVTISANGVLFFDGATGSGSPTCPGSTTGMAGVAAYWDDLAANTAYTRAYGTWPRRTFVVSWPAFAHARAGGAGAVQAWLVEGRNEIVIVHADTTFGDPTVDNAASAAVGVFGDGAGAAWTCSAALADGTSAWFGDRTNRPARVDVPVDTLDDGPWYGTGSFAYAGRAVAAGDVNGDGTDDLVVGNENGGAGRAYLVYRPDAPSDLSDADATFNGATSGDAMGAAVLVADLDGDGAAEVIVGATTDDGGVALAGAVYVYAGGGVAGTYRAVDASDAWRGASSGRPAVGAALASGDVDGDGYADLLIGSPTDDAAGTDAGAAYLIAGGTTGGGVRSVTAAQATFSGATGDQLGRSLAAADLDGDGAAELLIGGSYADDGALDGGDVWILDGGAWAGTVDVPAAAACTVTGADPGARFGDALALGDLDDDDLLDLIVGAPAGDAAPGRDAGEVFVYLGASTSACPDSTAPDTTIDGRAASANLGDAVVAADLDGDGRDDLVAGAPNSGDAAVGGGAAYVYTSPPSGSVTTYDADHRLMGVSSAGALSTALAAARDADGGTTLVATAPFASYGYTSDGAVYQWRWRADFPDDDADGFVAAASGGNDCDDADPDARPGGTDVDGDAVDGDCDGWVDGVLAPRDDADGWAWDLEGIGASSTELYDFESLVDGAVLGSLGGLRLSGGVVSDRIAGAWPNGELGGQAVPDGTNLLTMDLGAGADALAFQLLDPNGTFTLTARGPDGVLVPAYTFVAEAEDLPGGLFRGFTFSRTVTAVTISGAYTDVFGIDDLEVAWADQTDRDRDGWSDADGDCDDEDPDVSPDATESYGNGIDDDCDGVVDAGAASAGSDTAAWADAAELFRTTVVDFEDVTTGTSVTTEYVPVGVLLAGLTATAEVGVTAAIGTLAGGASSSGATLAFLESQDAVAFTLLDADAPVTVTALVDGEPAYVLSVGGSGGQAFVGLLFEVPVDTLVLTAADTFGIDDLTFEGLGQDDADGDGLTETDGDCNDADATAYPDAADAPYDGIDSDCAGDDDYDADRDGSDITLDCDDDDPDAYPGAEEIPYDGIDSNCDSVSDFDADLDGHDDAAWGGDDCDDTDGSISPDAEETWYDGVDQDCAGDDDYDKDGDGVSLSGTFEATDCDDDDASAYPGAPETWYDGVDSDCSGSGTSDYDFDGDGHDAEAWGGDDCEDDDASAYPGQTFDLCYDGVDQDCDGDSDDDCDEDGYDAALYSGTDCDDADPDIRPGADDPPRDGIDTNCDGAPEYDDDGDGYDGAEDGGSDCDDTRADVYPGAPDACYDGLDADCASDDDDDCDADGHADAARGGDDCDDADGAVHPDARDFPYDGTDHDCDGANEFDIDGDGAASAWYGGDDCDDADPTVFVGAVDDWYDGVDSDCVGNDDLDADGDGARWDGVGGTDCDDADPSVSPAAAEVLDDGIDQDCDGSDAVTCNDCDGDGWTLDLDCDDADATSYPGASDRPYDGVDADCAGNDDFDADRDGAAAAAWGGTDCDDADAARFPGAADGCGGGDADCDGEIDEDCVSDTDTAADTGRSDTGDGTDTGGADSAPDDSGTRPEPEDTARPAPPDLTAPEPLPASSAGCGCASGGNGTPFVGAGLLALLFVSRRRGRSPTDPTRRRT